MSKLIIRGFAGLSLLLIAMAAMLFVPAGTADYWQAWAFLAVYFACSIAIIFYLVNSDPKLMERRMRGGPIAEKEPAQKIIMSVTSLGFVGLLVVSGLDRRFGWSQMPPGLALAGDGLVAIGWLAFYFVFRENSFSSATIELAPDQRVISTSPYARIRHPMYAGALVMLAGHRSRSARGGACSSSSRSCRR